METDSSSWCWFVLIISYTVVNFINSPQYRYNPHIRAFFSSCSTKWSPTNYLCCPKVQGIKHTHYHQNGTGLCYQAIWQSIWQGQIEYDPQYHYAKLHEWAASKYMFQYPHHHQLYPEIPASKWRQLSCGRSQSQVTSTVEMELEREEIEKRWFWQQRILGNAWNCLPFDCWCLKKCMLDLDNAFLPASKFFDKWTLLNGYYHNCMTTWSDARIMPLAYVSTLKLIFDIYDFL